MKNLRKPTFRKVITAFFLINFLGSVLLPNYTFALTGGPHQIEYTSYEEPGATDMVNLLTGDFTYNLPILDIPGPEGSFSLPLSYHAGIGLDQEASWVGLGWTMNPGAIVRNINEYPDDANGQSNTVKVQDLTGVWGIETNLIFEQRGWNNQVGHYGSMNFLGLLQSSWVGDKSNVGIFGINISSDGGASFDPLSFMNAVMTVASFASQTITQVANSIFTSSLIDGTTSVLGAIATTDWRSSGGEGYWKYTTKKKGNPFLRTYRSLLDRTRVEDMYGTLHLGAYSDYETFSGSGFWANVALTNGGVSTPIEKFKKSNSTYNRGAASDISFTINENGTYENSNNPTLLAPDNYQVLASGISGNISPYRFEVGSVSMPREMTKNHDRFAPVKFQDYKVPFLYDGVPVNSYFHHVGGASQVNEPLFHFGIGHTYASNTLIYNLNDHALKNERIRTDVNLAKKLPMHNHVEWLTNDEIKNNNSYPSKFIDFLSGGGAGTDRHIFRTDFTFGGSSTPKSHEISTMSFSPTFIVDQFVFNELIANVDVVDVDAVIYPNFESQLVGMDGQIISMKNLMVTGKSNANGQYTITVSNHTNFQTHSGKHADVVLTYLKIPQNPQAIGGYVITSANGVSYHFGLPVYDYDNKIETRDVSVHNKRSEITRKAGFASAWLLTAITYSDFIDRNSNGIIDDGDWGGWIKFNYGKHSDKYDWRIPYDGFNRDAKNERESYSQGSKQLYYLNTIETRSHVALFLKGTRLDGRGKNNVYPLKLEEVVILNREHYKKLTSQNFNMPEFTNSINYLCLSTFFTASKREFVNNNAVKRIEFGYNYYLTPNTINSNGHGKLTLNYVAIKSRGMSNENIIPSYKFGYGNNYTYDRNHWDGWGMYNPNGTTSGLTHRPSQFDQYGLAWSLNKIITPLGSEIHIEYERDDYSSISNEEITGNITYSSDQNLDDGIVNSFYSNPSFQEGDRVLVSVIENYPCTPIGSCDDPYTGQQVPCDDEPISMVLGFSHGKIVSNQVILDQPITFSLGTHPCPNGAPNSNSNHTISLLKDIKGGDIRVSKITMQDEFGIKNSMRYLYSRADGRSSGVLAKQNSYNKSGTYYFENLPGYPTTPVMYGSVTLLNGELTNDNDFHTKTVYEFETPFPNMILKTSSPKIDNQLIRNYEVCEPPFNTPCISWKDYLSIWEHTIKNYTSRIGNLKSVKIYDRNNILKSNSQLNYTPQLPNDVGNEYMGIYSQGTLKFERYNSGDNLKWYHKASRSTVLRYPYVLKEVINTKDDNISKSEYIKWDFITGNVLEKVETSPLGLKVKSVTVPAYKQTPYAEFGPKAFSLSNKNMLSQVAEEYTYLLDANGAEVGLLGASAQTWKKDWNNYRIYSGGTYTQGSEGDPVWRKGAAYVWRGDYNRLQADGSQTFAAGDKFNFSNIGSNPGWEYVGEPLRYDHYSMTLESKDRNNIYASSKMGYDNKIKILSASNAEYTEVAFSSAEDYDVLTGHFGGEVALKSSGGNATVIKKSGGEDSHTGDCAIQLSSGYGFVYKPTGLKTNKKYRASVWTKSTNGRIYYKLNGGGEVLSPAPTVATKAGNWYLINFEIPIGASFTSLEVGVKSTSGTVQFDDFRFQPTDASMVCYVYNPLTHDLTGTNLEYSEYVLDNDNLYTRYLYSAKGQLHKTFRESIKYNGEKLVSESTSDYRRFYINQ